MEEDVRIITSHLLQFSSFVSEVHLVLPDTRHIAVHSTYMS